MKQKEEREVMQRDLDCLRWIAEMEAVRVDHLTVLLSRFCAGCLATEQVVSEHIKRWEASCWVVCERLLSDGPPWIYVTDLGLSLVGVSGELFVPSLSHLSQIYALNRLRLLVEERGGQWISLRYLPPWEKKPDGIITTSRGCTHAVLVEMRPLLPGWYIEKARGLLQKYPSLRWYVPQACQKVAMEQELSGCDELEDRVWVRLDEGLQMRVQLIGHDESQTN